MIIARIDKPTTCLSALIGTVAIAANNACAIPTWTEIGDASQLLSLAQIIPPLGNPLVISGSTGPGDLVDVYYLPVLTPSTFSASTAFGGASWDTQLFLFGPTSLGVQANDNGALPGSGLQSILGGPLSAGEPGTGIIALPPGFYSLAITGAGVQPFSAGGDIFDFQTPFQQSGADGPGGTMRFLGWHGDGPTGSYMITVTGLFTPAPPSMGLVILAALAGRRRRRV